jgi:hypothetical protein
MKLLLISDQNTFLSQFEKTETGYVYGAIQIQFIQYLNTQSLLAIREKLISERFHLVLSYTEAVLSGPFMENTVFVNAVNNYLALHLREDANFFDEDDMTNPPVSIVNRTTSYFNVFLEISKAVAFTTKNNISDLDLPRLDVISEINYYLAYFLYKNKCNYYLLNYRKDTPINNLLNILEKLD